jgi:hypothetical protein
MRDFWRWMQKNHEFGSAFLLALFCMGVPIIAFVILISLPITVLASLIAGSIIGYCLYVIWDYNKNA